MSGVEEITRNFRECGILLFIFHGYFGNTKAAKVNFWSLIVLSSFCIFCRFLPCTFAFCPISSVDMDIEFQGNFFNYFIHTFYINYSLCHCEASSPHVCTNVSV